MASSGKRLPWLLVVCLLVEAGIALVLRGPGSLRLVEGRWTGTDVLSLIGLLWLPLLAVLFWAMARRVLDLRAGLDDRDMHLADLAATSHDWLFQAAPDLTLTNGNPASAELLGYPPEDLVGRCAMDLVHPDDVSRARAALAAAVRDHCGWTDLELRWRHSAGHVFTLQGSASPILDRSGALVGFRGTWRAVSSGSSNARRLQAVAHRTADLIAARSLRIALQPIIDIHTGSWVGVEALSRFPDGGSPGRWFIEAREAGAGLALEMHAFEAALDVLPTVPDGVYLSLNASPGAILDPAFDRLMDDPSLPIDRIVVEITEHPEVSQYEDIRAALLPYRERGLRLAVDDAGAGYASLNHVLKLRPDIIKLDRSLVTTIDEDGARRALVTAIVMLGIETQAQVTAEGVETTTELDVLRSLGVDTVQGYLLARPSVDRSRLQVWRTRDWLEHAGIASPATAPLPTYVR